MGVHVLLYAYYCPGIYTTLGVDYDDRVLPSITNEVLKAVVAQFDAGELITQREIVSSRIDQVPFCLFFFLPNPLSCQRCGTISPQELTKRAEHFGVILDDISITHCTFGREFTQAVELKQVAQQEAEKAR